MSLFSRETAEARAYREAREEHQRRYEAAAAPILADLNAHGLRLGRLPELHEISGYEAQIPLLIDWLGRAEFPAVVETLARGLTLPAARGTEALPELIAALRRLPREEHVPRQALGNAIGFLAGADDFDTVVALLDEPDAGLALLPYFGRLKAKAIRERSVKVLTERLADPVLGREASRLLAKLNT